MNIHAAGTALLQPPGQALPEDLEGACRALEKEFALLVFRKMREAMVPRSGEGAMGFARDTSEGMLDAQWADLASQGEGLGLWRALMRQLEPSEVKSGSPGAEKTRMEAEYRKEAGHEPERGTRTLGPGLGRAGLGTAATADPGVPGVPGAAVLSAPGATPTGRKGT